MKSIRSVYFILFLFLIILSIVLISLSAINIKIAPAPYDLKTIPSYFNKTFCIPCTQFDNLSDEREVRRGINSAYYLMVGTFVSGIVLFIMSVILFIMTWRSKDIQVIE